MQEQRRWQSAKLERDARATGAHLARVASDFEELWGEVGRDELRETQRLAFGAIASRAVARAACAFAAVG